MAKFPYGGFEADPPKDEPWVRLKTIAEHLEDGDALPPHLAQWLAQAIRRSNENENSLLTNLGLKMKRGRQKVSDDAWLKWGGRIDDLEDQGFSKERAIEKALQEAGDSYSRTAMQEMRDTYKKAKSMHDEECR